MSLNAPLPEYLDRPIAFQRAYVSITGSITAALMLSQAVYWSTRTTDPDGWFFKTQVEWEEETGMTRTEQETARRKLENLGLMSEDKRGVPCRVHYRVENIKLLDLLKLRYKLVCGKPANWIAGKPQTRLQESNKLLITETTSETTASFARFSSSDAEKIYQAYPRHVGKAVAIKAIFKALSTLDYEDPVTALLNRVREFAGSPAGNKGEHTPHPATWFNRNSFLDDPKEWER